VNNLDGLIDLIDLQKVDEVLVGLARTAYNGLTLEQQALVTNYNNLVSAENLLKA
jgi:hypothetical protein